MAIQFARCEYVSRSSGGNACRKASYNQREQIRCERTGELFSFQERGGNVHHEILIPLGAHEKFKNSTTLWNEVEACERRINSQLAKEFVIALPDNKKVTLEDRIELTRRFGQIFIERGVAVQVDVHSPHERERNWHAHLLVTTRRFSEDGLIFGEKARDLDPVVRKGLVVESNLWGEIWRDLQNAYFEEKGYDIRVDPIGIIPQEHIGPVRMRHHMNEAVLRAQLLQKANEKLAQDPLSVIEELTRIKAVFSEGDVDAFLKKHVPSNERDGLSEKILENSHVIPLYDKDTQEKTKYFTTDEVRVEEEKLLRFIEGIANTSRSSLKSSSNQKGQIEKSLTAEQKEAYDHCVSSNKNLILIQGRAGVGKSYVLDAIRKAHEEDGYRVLGLAATHKVALDLKENGFIEAKTCHSFLFAFKNNRDHLNSKTLVMVDEAGMLGTTLSVELFHAIKSKGAKLILVGDDRQLSSVERGGSFSVLAERYNAVELKDVRRQTIGWQKSLSEALSEGHVKEAVHYLNENKAISWTPTKEEALAGLLKDWAKESLLNPHHSRLILAQQNIDVDALNQGAREILRQQGRVGDSEITCSTSRGRASFAIGDRVQLTKTDQVQSLLNGSFGTIEHINPKTKKITLHLDNGETKEIDPNLYDGLRHGYAATVYKSQGSTLDHVYVLYSRMTNSLINYVALTRQTKSLSLYVSQDEALSLTHLIRQMGRLDTQGMSLGFDTKRDIEKKQENKPVPIHLKHHAQQWLTKVADHFHKNERFYDFKKPQSLPQEPATFSVFQEKVEPQTSLKDQPIRKSTEHSLTKSFQPFTNVQVVEEALKQNMAAFADDVFSSLGKSLHQASSSSTQRRYGERGHITVNLRTGAWIDFRDSDMAGGPLHLLTKLKGLSFKEAVDYGAAWAGLTSEGLKYDRPLPQKSKTEILKKDQENKDKIAKVQALWNKGQPIQGTLAERYLRKHRKIEGELPKDLRYLPSFYDRSSQTKHPSLMATARNPEGQITAVQITFLDSETGKKASLDVAKKSFGVLKGSAVILQENPSGPLFIAEGVETALSLKSAGVEGTIQASLGLSNMRRLGAKDLQTPLIICADHDAPESPAAKSLEKSVLVLQEKGFHVTVIKPEKLNQDFNDVLKEKGPQGVREILQKSLPDHETHPALQNQVVQENPFDKIRLICEKQLYDYLKSEKQAITTKLKTRITIQSERAADLILHQHQGKPTQEETKLYLLRAKYELDRIPEIRRDLIEEWREEGDFNKKKDPLLAHMIAERQASIEGRLYFEAKKVGKEPSTQIPELAEKELDQHHKKATTLAKELSQTYSLSKELSLRCAKDILRYNETHGEKPTQHQVEQLVEITKNLAKTYPYQNKETFSITFQRIKETDLIFRQLSLAENSTTTPDLTKIQDQAKTSLEQISLQVTRDLQRMMRRSNQLELGM